MSNESDLHIDLFLALQTLAFNIELILFPLNPSLFVIFHFDCDEQLPFCCLFWIKHSDILLLYRASLLHPTSTPTQELWMAFPLACFRPTCACTLANLRSPSSSFRDSTRTNAVQLDPEKWWLSFRKGTSDHTLWNQYSWVQMLSLSLICNFGLVI